MGEYQHYNSFCLRSPITGETRSLKDDYNGIIINENATTYDRECMPDLNIITDKISGVDGELFMKANYQPRVISMTVFFGEIEKTDGDFVRFKEWVGKKYPQEFSWEDDWEEDKYLNVLLYKGFETKTIIMLIFSHLYIFTNFLLCLLNNIRLRIYISLVLI